MENTEAKQRHGCLTAWLILMIIANSLTTLTYTLFWDSLSDSIPQIPSDSIAYLLALMSLLNLIFAVMLLKWKKWAFWGFVGSSLVVLVINLSIGLGVGNSILGLLGVAILLGVLQIKKDGVSGWDNLA